MTTHPRTTYSIERRVQPWGTVSHVLTITRPGGEVLRYNTQEIGPYHLRDLLELAYYAGRDER